MQFVTESTQYYIDRVTIVTGVLSDVSKTRRLSLVFRAGSK